MKVKLLTVCTDPSNEALQLLKFSLDKHNWPYEILVAPEWKGFGLKLLTIYDYLKTSDVDAFFFCDAYDCVALYGIEEAIYSIKKNYGLDKIVFSSERGCWPIPDYAKYYEPILDHRYNYLNSGLYYAPKQSFIDLMEQKMPLFESDDQLYMSEHYLFNENSNIVLDQNCEVFQSYSFIDPDDYEYGERELKNLKTGTKPVLIHGNGKQDLSLIYKML